MVSDDKIHVIVVGSGAAGLSAAWLLSRQHRVTLIEKEDRLGGHAHTATIAVDANDVVRAGESYPGLSGSPDGNLKIDTGFIVYNEPCYPNLVKWFETMGVDTEFSDMSFAVSRDNGNFEYAGGPATGLIAQRNLPFKRRFWRMLIDLVRFYRQAPGQIGTDTSLSLGEFLDRFGYSDAFVNDHLLPFGSAIWSTPKDRMLDYPALSFIRFCENHGLLKLTSRPQWRTVSGGSEQYVEAARNAIGQESILTDFKVSRVSRSDTGVSVSDQSGNVLNADHVVIATHADQALHLLDSPTPDERSLLSAFSYESNDAWLHTDTSYLPVRRRAWCSWNYVERNEDSSSRVCVSYWMNRLQNLQSDTDYVVTLNPDQAPSESCVLRKSTYEHPVFTASTYSAQQNLWSLQGQQRTWFCGSYFGSGFHEDAVQSGLAVAEQLGELPRPWQIENPSTRIVVPSLDLANHVGSAEAIA